MAVYNTNPRYLREAIDSILNQTYTDFEFLIVNDASTNADVEEVIGSYADERIRYYVNECNMGISPTRNRLMGLARGEYFAVMDHDDISLPERLAEQVAYLDAHPEVGVVGSFVDFFKKRSSPKEFPVDDLDIRVSLVHMCAIHHPASMIRKQVLAEHNLRYEEVFSPAEDYALWYRLIPHTKFHNIPIVLFRYRLYEANTIRVQERKVKRAAIVIRSRMRNEYPLLYYQYLERTKAAIHISRIKLFGKMPLLKIVQTEEQTVYFLFNRVPVLTMKKQIRLPSWC